VHTEVNKVLAGFEAQTEYEILCDVMPGLENEGA
jgi:hypothetical protein